MTASSLRISNAVLAVIRAATLILAVWYSATTSSTRAQAPAAKSQPPQPLSTEQRTAFDESLKSLRTSLAGFGEPLPPNVADAGIFAKGLEWALAYDREFSMADSALLDKAVSRGRQRIAAVTKGEAPWLTRRGKVALGYVSRVDGSIQPYGLIVPKEYDATRPWRLDVVLHGSTRPVGLSELRFMSRFDEGDDAGGSAPDQPFLELHPLGRVENCYRWAGETDVWEAIEDVCRRFRVDRERIVLRGMSMGASGTWHLGLKHPDRFVALGPYCGYVDTHRFSETPLPNFVKVGPLPAHQELGLHMLDSIDYAANAAVVPSIACMGEKDVFFQAHELMREAMQREGLTMVNLISPGTGHVIDPVTHSEQMRRIATHVDRGLDRAPRDLRFVTWTLKYSRCHWLQVLGLERHYARAEISGRWRDELIEIDEPRNITRFAILTDRLPQSPRKLRMGRLELDLPPATTPRPPAVVVVKREQQWALATERDLVARGGKRPGAQGPIDDAFTTPFLCVRGTGTPWNAAVQGYADASLRRFAGEWRRYFRGDLPIKDDSAVTAEDLRTRNLILFGDPGSNSWIGELLPQLPLAWTRESLRLAGREYAAANHAPAFIFPNPHPDAAHRYVVVNSGHTFREAELSKLNYLLFPRWGDWAVLRIDPRTGAGDAVTEEVLTAGYFDETWRAPAP